MQRGAAVFVRLINNCSCESKGAFTLANFSCNFSRDFAAAKVLTLRNKLFDGCYTRLQFAICLVFDDQTSLKKHFQWLVPPTVATQVVGKILRFAMLEKFLAMFREALRKLELNYTFRNGSIPYSCNVLGSGKLCHIGQCFVQLSCLAMGLRDKLHKKLHSVTAP